MYDDLQKQRNKWGTRYDVNNPYERLADRFGTDPSALIKEYDLILDKKSRQPSSVRMPIKYIVSRDMDRLLADKARKYNADKTKSKLNATAQQ